MSYSERQEARKQRFEELAANAESQSNAAHSQARRMGENIPFGQPILIGHHSEGRDRRYRARITGTYEKSFALMGKAEHYRRKAAGVGTAGISSDDENAIEKLTEQLTGLQAKQERMKAVNKVIRQRAGDTDAQIDGLLALGWLTNEQARELVEGDFCKRVGYPSYALTNNNANIRRIEQRIKELEARAKLETKEEKGRFYTYREDTDENRVMFIFDGKPSEAIRAILKSNAFKWSPSRGAWVRQLNANGKWAASCVKQKLDAMESE